MKEIYPFRFFFRKADSPSPPGVFVRVGEYEELDSATLVNRLRDMPLAQWQATKQLLLEAKYKSEALLRDEKVVSDHGRMAFLAGFAAYADYVIASFETLRATPHPEDFPEPGT